MSTYYVLALFWMLFFLTSFNNTMTLFVSLFTDKETGTVKLSNQLN